MQTGGPAQPLLPQLTAEEKFSDRFELEEEPFFFYDLFGKELLEGNEVHQYIEEKQFDAAGNLVLGRTGQLDSVRYVSQLDRTVLTEDTYRGRHTEFTIGDHLTIKDKTLWPVSYIIHKTEFDGFRWDLSFQTGKHLFSLLNSRISNQFTHQMLVLQEALLLQLVAGIQINSLKIKGLSALEVKV